MISMKKIMILAFVSMAVCVIILKIVAPRGNFIRTPETMMTVEIDKQMMSYYVLGEGDKAAVFLSGWGTPSPFVDFVDIAKRLPEGFKGLIIEKFGYGFSELTTRKRSLQNIVEELEVLIKASGVEKPFIIVAHSLASIEALSYSIKNPDDVAGILLLDAGSPEYYAKIKPLLSIPKIQRFAGKIGLTGLMLDSSNGQNLLSGEANGYSKNEWSDEDRKYYMGLLKSIVVDDYPSVNMLDELKLSQKNALLLSKNKVKLDIPIIALTADMFGKQSEQWILSQKSMETWSTSFEWQLVPNSDHYIHHYQPELVLKAITQLQQYGTGE